MEYVKSEIISLKNSAEYNEKWLQARREEDPSILGLGELDFRDSEKMLVGGGRLDTILYDPEYKKRYEVEIQLGKTDESHIIRTIAYWEKKAKKESVKLTRRAAGATMPRLVLALYFGSAEPMLQL